MRWFGSARATAKLRFPMRKTRIVCTLGPSSVEVLTLRRLFAAGMDVARLNFSHGDEATHRAAVKAVRQVAQETGRYVALLQDLQGPKIRTGALTEPLVRVLLADGQIELKVRGTHGNGQVTCSVVRGGLLGERKGVAIPGRSLTMPALTAKDKQDLALGAELQFDYVAISFVRSPADVQACREEMERLGWRAPVVAKLEKLQAIRNLRDIIAASDAVMVARGDLGVEMALGEVPAIQKDIINRANRAGVPVITATEMLESMVTSNRPTRAEASDVANAIWDGTDAVMLSQETSTGAHPVEAVRAMSRICLAAENHPAYLRERPVWKEDSLSSAIAHASAQVATEVNARYIIAFTESGATALRVSKSRPPVPVIAASPYGAVLRRTALYAGVIPLEVGMGKDTDDMIDKAVKAAMAQGIVRNGDRVLFIAGVPVGKPGQTNMLKVETIRE
ncbi:MAG: pyruvate kinase [Chloroflexi bacterium]|nr:MAG: pyruvate kinase [Chloroflexota bacterium]